MGRRSLPSFLSLFLSLSLTFSFVLNPLSLSLSLCHSLTYFQSPARRGDEPKGASEIRAASVEHERGLVSCGHGLPFLWRGRDCDWALRYCRTHRVAYPRVGRECVCVKDMEKEERRVENETKPSEKKPKKYNKRRMRGREKGR